MSTTTRITDRQRQTQNSLILSPMDRPIRRPWITVERLVITAALTVFLAAAAYGYVRYGLNRTLTVNSQHLTVSPGALMRSRTN